MTRGALPHCPRPLTSAAGGGWAITFISSARRRRSTIGCSRLACKPTDRYLSSEVSAMGHAARPESLPSRRRIRSSLSRTVPQNAARSFASSFAVGASRLQATAGKGASLRHCGYVSYFSRSLAIWAPLIFAACCRISMSAVADEMPSKREPNVSKRMFWCRSAGLLTWPTGTGHFPAGGVDA